MTPGVQVLVHAERLPEECVGIGQGVLALGDAELAEVLPGRPVRAHIVRCQEGEVSVGAAGTVGIDGILGVLAETAEHLAEAVHMVGVAGDTGHQVGIAALHGAGGAAQGH